MGAAEKLVEVEVEAREWPVRRRQRRGRNALPPRCELRPITGRLTRRAHRAGRRERQGEELSNHDAIAQQKAFLAALSPVWTWLLENADTQLAVDPEQPHIIWGWCVTSAPNVVHAVGAKRSLIEAGVAADVVRDLLGDRMERHQVCSLELPQLPAYEGR